MRHRIVTLSNVSISDEKGTGLRNCSLTIERGEILGVYGPRYSGKASLFGLLHDGMFPESGSVLFYDDRDIVIEDPKKYPTCCILDRRCLMIDDLSIWENLTLLWKKNSWKQQLFAGTAQRRRMQIALSDFHLNIDLNDRAASLSDLLRLCVCIVAARLRGIELLLIDGTEISGSLEDFEFLGRLLQIMKEEKMTVLCYSHRIAYMAMLTDRIAFLYGGRIVRMVYRNDTYESDALQVYRKLYEIEGVPGFVKQEKEDKLYLEMFPVDRRNLQDRELGILKIPTNSLSVVQSRGRALYPILKRRYGTNDSFCFLSLDYIDEIQREMRPVENLCMGLYDRLNAMGVVRSARVNNLLEDFLEWYGDEFPMDYPDSTHLLKRQRAALNLYCLSVRKPKILICEDQFLHNDRDMLMFVCRVFEDLIKAGGSILVVTGNLQEWTEFTAQCQMIDEYKAGWGQR